MDKRCKESDESDKDEMTALNKKRSNRLNVVTDFVEKQQKDSDLPVSEGERNTKGKGGRCFETGDHKMINRRTIFVKGFDCSLALDEIKSQLTKLFSSCGEVARVYLPSGDSIGYAYINLRSDEKEALKLHGTPRLGVMCLEVTMAYGRREYDSFINHRGCGRCRYVRSDPHFKRR